MKIDRLLAITTILLNRGTVTARELAERFEVSTRTVYRDVEVLSAAGVPVYASKGNGGGIGLVEGFALDRTLISDQESEGILLALKTLQAARYPEVDGILDKFGALFKNTSAIDWIEVDFTPWGKGPEEGRKFNTLRQGILQRRVVQFDYVGADGQRSSRNAEPMALHFKGTAWYLRAWCRTKQEIRTFRVTRIRNAVLAGEVFERKDESQISREDAGTGGDGRPMTALRLRFRPRAQYRLYDDYDESMIKRNEDGSLELNISFPEDEWVVGYLLSFGPDVEVLEPGHIRRMLAERMREALKYYG